MRLHSRSRVLAAFVLILAAGFGSASAAWDELLNIQAWRGQPMMDIWGFGDTVAAVGGFGVIRAWDGTVWKRMESGFCEPLVDVWGASPDDLYAMGSTELRHWDGTEWTEVISDIALGDLWGSGSDDLYVVGTHGLVKHWDGQQWQIMHPWISAELYTCWGAGRDDFYAAGSYAVCIHWDGSHWTHVEKPAGWQPSYLALVWAASGGDMVLVSEADTYHKRNGVWNKVPADRVPLQVRGSSADDIYLVGRDGFIMQWDGRAWTTIASGVDADLTAVWPDPRGFAYITGEGSILLRVEHGAVEMLNEPADRVEFSRVWSAGPNDIAAVSSIAGPASQFRHWDGREWTMSILEGEPVSALWGADPDALFAVCGMGSVHAWDGRTWTDLACPATRPIRGLWGFGKQDLWVLVCGEPRASNPAVLRWDGAEWTRTPIPTGQFPDVTYQSIWGAAPDNLWLGGNDRVTHWNGATWSDMGMPPRANALRIIRGSSSGEVFMISWQDDWNYLEGDYTEGVISCWTGGRWERLNTTHQGRTLSSLAPLQDGSLFAAGGDRTLMRWDGSQWWSWGHEVPVDIIGLCPSDPQSAVALTKDAVYRWDGTVEPQPVLSLSLASARVQPGEAFWVRAALDNPSSSPLPDSAVYFALEVAGVYYFWPSWTQCRHYDTPDYGRRAFLPGLTEFYPIPSFVWPSGSGSMRGLHFYAIVMNSARTAQVTNFVETGWDYGP